MKTTIADGFPRVMSRRGASGFMRTLSRMLVAASVLLSAACALPSTASVSSETAVARRLAQYVDLLRRQDSSAIADMFEPAGAMSHEGQRPIVGREAIRALLDSFASYKVLAHRMQVTSAVRKATRSGRLARMRSLFVDPEGRTLQVGGMFTAVWQQEDDGQWLIQSMRTAPGAQG